MIKALFFLSEILIGLFLLPERVQAEIVELNLNKITKRRLHFNGQNNTASLTHKNLSNHTFLRENSNFQSQLSNISSNVDLRKNENSNLYTINLEIGSEKEKFTILIDSGSNILWIPSSECSQCSNNIRKFNSSGSNTFKNLSEYQEIHYHDGAFSKGFLGKDEVKLGEFFTNITFLLSYLINNEIIGIDGILGLGPNPDSNSSIITTLYTTGKISKKMYTQVFNNLNDTGRLIIGDYPLEISQNMENYSFCPIVVDSPHSHHWVCHIDSSYIGHEYSINRSIEIKKEVIFDSGTNVLIFDNSYKTYFLNSFFGKYIDYCFQKNDNYFCHSEIEKHLPPLHFNFNGWTYKIDPQHLFHKSENNPYLQLMVEFNNTDIWNFGLPFLNNYYVTYNFEDNTVGFFGGNRYNSTTYYIDPPSKGFKLKPRLILGAGVGLFILISYLFYSTARRVFSKRTDSAVFKF